MATEGAKMIPEPLTIWTDTREPWPHPWAKWLPNHVQLERATLETGDFCVAGLSDGAIVERKRTADFVSCVTSNRERFERELARSRHVGRFIILIEGSLFDCIDGSGGLSEASLIGTVAAWTRRYCPILFAGDERHAAVLAWRYLAGQISEGHRLIKAISETNSGAVLSPKPQAVRALAGHTRAAPVSIIEER